jgi:hypothetical protein
MSLKHALNAGVSRVVLAGIVSGLLLTACKPNSQPAASSAPPPLAALPLATTAAPPIVPAPTADALPSAPPANVGSLANGSDRYAFADRAYAMSSAFGDAPPDYTFDYGDGERPWVWRGDDQSTRVAEPLPGGGYRYYYYEPGADTPYLVRDPDDSYGYDNGVLVVIYDHQGRALPSGDLRRRADAAGRFLARAQAIYQASQRQQREAVAQANWAARRSEIDAERSQWAADQAADPDWRAYHQANAPQEDSHWDAERYRRESEAARFAQSINDQPLAQRDWQAAQKAQVRAASAGQPKPPTQTGPGPQVVVAPPTSPASGPPHDHRSSSRLAGGPAATPATPSSGPMHDHQPPSSFAGGPRPQGPGNGLPSSGQPAVVHAEPRRPNPSHAPANAALQAQQQAEAGRKAQAQAAITHQNQVDAQHRALIDAQNRAQADAAHQAQTQAAASHLAQTEANHRAEMQTQNQARQQAQAAQQAKRDVHQPPPAAVIAPVHHADAPKPPTAAPPAPPHDNRAHDPHHGAPKDRKPGDKP